MTVNINVGAGQCIIDKELTPDIMDNMVNNIWVEGVEMGPPPSSIGSSTTVVIDPETATRSQNKNKLQRFGEFVNEDFDFPFDIPFDNMVAPGGMEKPVPKSGRFRGHENLPKGKWRYARVDMTQVEPNKVPGSCGLIAAVAVFLKPPRYIYYNMGLKALFLHGGGVDIFEYFQWYERHGCRIYDCDENLRQVRRNNGRDRDYLMLEDEQPCTFHHSRIAGKGGIHLVTRITHLGHVIGQRDGIVYDTAQSYANKRAEGIHRVT